MRKLGVVLVKAPDELMYWPRLFLIATEACAICWSSSTRPLMKILPSVKTVPSVGASRFSVTVGGRSPGYAGYRAVAPVVEGSCCPDVS